MQTYLLFLFRDPGTFSAEALDRGEVDYVGSLRLKTEPRHRDRLPRDRRYLVVDPVSGALLRYDTEVAEPVLWATLPELFFGPEVSARVSGGGAFLDCTPPRRGPAGTAGLATALREAAPFAEPMLRFFHSAMRRTLEGKRSYFVTASAVEALLSALAHAMVDPDQSVRDIFPAVRIAQDQTRPHYADGP